MSDEIADRFAWHVRQARRSAGWTQRQLGDACGMDASAIARIETAQRTVSIQQAHAICTALDDFAPLKSIAMLSSAGISRIRAKAGAKGAASSWANTKDAPARTAPARAALEKKFLDAADGDAGLAADLRREHFARLAARSAEARRAKKRASDG